MSRYKIYDEYGYDEEDIIEQFKESMMDGYDPKVDAINWNLMSDERIQKMPEYDNYKYNYLTYLWEDEMELLRESTSKFKDGIFIIILSANGWNFSNCYGVKKTNTNVFRDALGECDTNGGGYDVIKWSDNLNGSIEYEYHHHDGTNYYSFMLLKPEFEDKVDEMIENQEKFSEEFLKEATYDIKQNLEDLFGKNE